MAFEQRSRTRLVKTMLAAIAAMVVTVLTVSSAQQASAAGSEAGDGDSVQAQIDAVLEQSPGGKQINENEIAWEDGTVILTFPMKGETAASSPGEPVSAQGVPNCEYTWTCLYEHANFDGRRLRFSACGYIQDLGAYGFSDMTTSWHNNQSGGARTSVYDWRGAWVRIWITGNAPSYSTNVGEANNDTADGIRAC